MDDVVHVLQHVLLRGVLLEVDVELEVLDVHQLGPPAAGSSAATAAATLAAAVRGRGRRSESSARLARIWVLRRGCVVVAAIPRPGGGRPPLRPICFGRRRLLARDDLARNGHAPQRVVKLLVVIEVLELHRWLSTLDSPYATATRWRTMAHRGLGDAVRT